MTGKVFFNKLVQNKYLCPRFRYRYTPIFLLFSRNYLQNEPCISCSSCGRFFDVNCSSTRDLAEHERTSWLCKVRAFTICRSYLDKVSNDRNFLRIFSSLNYYNVLLDYRTLVQYNYLLSQIISLIPGTLALPS